MWSISEVKSSGMSAVRRNYWKCVLVGLLFSFTGATLSFSVNPNDYKNLAENGFSSDSFKSLLPMPENEHLAGFLVGAIAVIGFIAVIAEIAAQIFALNPLRAGCCEYMHRNLFSVPSLKNAFNGFKVKYFSKVKILFFTDLYIFLWSLLFIVPGIVKSYAYRLVPYIIAENPDISKDDALKLSSDMMDGNKGRAFGYDLSFIGWYIVSALTLGVLAVFYVYPYKNSSDAVLYERIKAEYDAKRYTQA